MRWFRSNIRTGVGLALFALTVQFAVTFSHVDLDGLALPFSHSRSHPGSSSTDRHGASLQKRSDVNHPQGIPDATCPICALIQLAGSSAPSVAPPLPVPALLAGSKLEPPMELLRTAVPLIAFRARGPPTI